MTNPMTISEFARLGGLTKSKKRRAASKSNGKKGGRPSELQWNEEPAKRIIYHAPNSEETELVIVRKNGEWDYPCGLTGGGQLGIRLTVSCRGESASEWLPENPKPAILKRWKTNLRARLYRKLGEAK